MLAHQRKATQGRNNSNYNREGKCNNSTNQVLPFIFEIHIHYHICLLHCKPRDKSI